MRTVFTAALAATALSHAPAALAQHSGDIILTIEGGRIVTNSSEGSATLPERVFESEFGEILPNFTNEPGFDSAPGTFPEGSSIAFTIAGPLRKWDGATFDTIPPERLTISFLSLPPATTPVNEGETVNGFALPVQGGGVWHRHYNFTLGSPASDGVYLLELVLTSTSPAIDASEPFRIVFGQNADHEDLDEAVEYARAQLVDCPGDTNGDGIVNFPDLNAVLNDFGHMGENLPGDVNGDGIVNFPDLNIVLNNFGADC